MFKTLTQPKDPIVEQLKIHTIGIEKLFEILISKGILTQEEYQKILDELPE